MIYSNQMLRLINEMNLTYENLSSKIDNAILKPNMKISEIKAFCYQSVEYKFASVAVNSGFASIAKYFTKESSTKVCCAIGFPLGLTSVFCKVAEIKDAISSGADELDFVINIGRLKSHDYFYIEKEIKELVEAAEGRTTKLIIETCYLNKNEKINVCKCALNTGIDFIKTSTGFGKNGATVDDVRLIKSLVKSYCKVKASGGINNLEDALRLIRSGADRIGTNSGVKIMDEFNKMIKT
ncbi:MAG: deoxyribose-phosphate aldolase [Candidatus Atribacteria bacterium]